MRFARLALVAVLGCVGLAVPAAFAGSAQAVIVYQCGGNLCGVNSDGSRQAQLTSDGQAGTSQAYVSPSLSRDGSSLAFVYDGRWYYGSSGSPSRTGGGYGQTTAIALLSPDKRAFAEIEFSLAGGPDQVCTYNLDGSGRSCPYGTASAGWGADDSHLLISTSAGAPNYNPEICELPVDGDYTSPCSKTWADSSARDLYDPAVSPDGSTLAVTVASHPSVRGYIALYSYATGEFIRNLTAPSNTADQTPVWSPDGSHIAFQRGSSIYVMPSGGPAGSAHQLVANGLAPTWGGPDVTTTSGQATAKPRVVAFASHCVRRHGRRRCTPPKPLKGHTYRGHASQGQPLTVGVESHGRYFTFTLKGLRFGCADGPGGSEDVQIVSGDRQRISRGTFNTEIDYTAADGFSHEVVYVVGAFDGHKAKGTVVGNTRIAGHGECTSGDVSWSAKT